MLVTDRRDKSLTCSANRGGADAVERRRFNHSGTRIPVRNSRQGMRPTTTSDTHAHILQIELLIFKCEYHSGYCSGPCPWDLSTQPIQSISAAPCCAIDPLHVVPHRRQACCPSFVAFARLGCWCWPRSLGDPRDLFISFVGSTREFNERDCAPRCISSSFIVKQSFVEGIKSSSKKLRRGCATWLLCSRPLQLYALKRKAHRRRGPWDM
ncbi:hypothetical protein C7974DRAFT_15304 [Boeremia exigua]|uniref:uncharacterized protein n=1 Tax=Boeremia exigua TaxID=749465 RepID=UPI001E8ED575|nr:uncharacterized protein C7974DRAFT_15304 [Boeremia exigua]KAH6644140.1 hypothetical protein C7974DRAFT_15304 [Boeremia exigua]